MGRMVIALFIANYIRVLLTVDPILGSIMTVALIRMYLSYPEISKPLALAASCNCLSHRLVGRFKMAA